MPADLQTIVLSVFMDAHKNVIISSYSFRMFPIQVDIVVDMYYQILARFLARFHLY